MPKFIGPLFLLVSLVCGLLSISSVPLGTAQSGQTVNGIISTDTSWTKENSPYNLTGNLLIDSGVTVAVETNAVLNLNGYYIRVNGTLNIQAGVTINMGITKNNPSSIQVNGILSARGTTANPIHFNGAIDSSAGAGIPSARSFVSFSASSTAWNEQTISGCVIENSILNQTSISVSATVKIESNELRGAGISAIVGSSIISHNLLSDGASISISRGSPLITNNQINGGYILIDGNVDSPIISSNIISNLNPKLPSVTLAGICVLGNFFPNEAGTISIERNIIKDSYYGIQLVENERYNMRKPIIIRYNAITNNEIGISITAKFFATINNNNIYSNNASINLSLYETWDVEASNNWWGTTDKSLIDQSILDVNDNFNLGKVKYTPILSVPDPLAPNPNLVFPDATFPSSTTVQLPIPNVSISENLNLSNNNSLVTQTVSKWDIFDMGLIGISLLALCIIIAIALFGLIRQTKLKEKRG